MYAFFQVDMTITKSSQLSLSGICMETFYRRLRKVVIIMGATGTGKSRLAIDLAIRFDGEVINSDKIQIHTGLPIVTNKVTEEECQGIPHHLLGIIEPDSDFTVDDFRFHVLQSVELILGRGKLPIIAGGSNSYIDALVNKDPEFQLRYDCCFIWVDVEVSVLDSFVSKRVDKMVEAGFVSEVRGMFDPKADNLKGIRRAIGVAELDPYFRIETSMDIDYETKKNILKVAIEDVKENTCLLAARQRQKIMKLKNIWHRKMHQIDATEVFLEGVETNEAWERIVAGPSTMKIHRFLDEASLSSSMIAPDATLVSVRFLFQWLLQPIRVKIKPYT